MLFLQSSLELQLSVTIYHNHTAHIFSFPEIAKWCTVVTLILAQVVPRTGNEIA